MNNRYVNKQYARVNGYFWLPCPLCGQHFGGHEWRDYNGLSSHVSTGEPGSGKGICPDCTKAGKGDDWDTIINGGPVAEKKPEFSEGDIALVTQKNGSQYVGVYTLAPGIDYYWSSVVSGTGGNQLLNPDVSAVVIGKSNVVDET